MRAQQSFPVLTRTAWMPLLLASGGCSMDLSLGDMSRDDRGLVDDGANAAVPATVDGALPPRLLPPEVTLGLGDLLLETEPVVGADLDGDGYGDLVVAGDDLATGTQILHIRYGGPRPSGDMGTFTWAESGARLMHVSDGAFQYNGVYAAGDVNGDGYDDLFVAHGVCDGPEPERGGYLVYGGPDRLDGIIDIESVSTHFIPPASTGNGTSCGYVFVAAPGDLDGDGLSDLALVYPGSPAHWTSSSDGAPTIAQGLPGVYVFYGRRDGFGASVSWASADARMSNALSGDPSGEADAIRVHAVGDLNGDGSAELLVDYESSAEYVTPTRGTPRSRTEQILVPGGERLPSSVDLYSLPLRFPGLFTQQGQRALGDVDADGYDDIIVRLEDDYLLFYGSGDLLAAPLAPTHAAARIVTEYTAAPRPLGDLDGDGDAELGVVRSIAQQAWASAVDLALLSGSRARLSGDVTFPPTSVAGARIYPFDDSAPQRTLVFAAPVGDIDGNGAGDVLSRSEPGIDDFGGATPMLHLHYGKPAEAAIPDEPR
jgi:hypothetical protein